MFRNGILTISTFVSAVLFPWPLTAVLALAVSFFEPLVALAAGLFVDTLYYVPQEGMLPIFTLSGLAVSVVATLVRNQLRAGPAGEV